ncbi:hypothetical protein SAMN05443662_0902 [Sulfurivirga caldicuralii]|uniref:Uncharacterized protein n=1 Tax=Sulfurivirga caldicuralii TaxID=364032 RepID=A0A1N6F3N3_9GAMM|nr:hypothetical protein [Sulfurivirga caldicuralii]SIN89857.1 hypothetical protein SAMN05443662_0902 [Sulfurivirga caldicuralii]
MQVIEIEVKDELKGKVIHLLEALQTNLIEHFTLLDEQHENNLYLEGVEKTLREWNSQENEQAYADL